MTLQPNPFHSALLAAGLLLSLGANADSALEQQVRKDAAAIESQLIEWRRDIHQHPELGEQETRTAKLVADHLTRLGMEVRSNIARTGVVGILKGGKPGRTVALRADMDALPVKEPSGLPFASKARGDYHGTEVDVMHACGHDAHTAMLMATAEVLSGMKDQLEGTVMFIFQPAEEGSSLVLPGPDASWGAKKMLEEGLFKSLKPDAIFAVHVMPGPSGQISWRSGATTAASDMLNIGVTGSQGHGGMPWNTIDPIVTSAQIINGIQTVVSRRANLTRSAVVITIGTIHGGSGPNIVPETVEMTGTIRTYDEGVRAQVGQDIKLSTEKIAESAGATADVSVEPMYSTTINDATLTERMAPVLERVADGKVATADLPGAAEDFSFFAQEVPGLYMFLGITPDGQDPATAAPNHNPEFFVDEKALVVGTRAMATLVVDYLSNED
ncbi:MULTISPECIES: amidohydrolase [Pseudomonas]|jgi:amidohydrolase|uniref:Amidohydrolase n=1 Tax=Serpens gallinarum TaxID=2763075 RepID=A0ABR8TRB0_9PSED|nr:MULTISPECIES: amidohydrolase [Pseudomonas]MBD7978303.1 amidohydrolase [Serpens gallinarum]MBF0676284.1 amidohydrolase [Pseudomonas sp.]